MTQEQRSKIVNAINALKALLSEPGVHGVLFEQVDELADFTRTPLTYRKMANILFDSHGFKKFDPNTEKVGLIMFNCGISRFDNWLRAMKRRNIVEIERKGRKIISVKFIKKIIHEIPS